MNARNWFHTLNWNDRPRFGLALAVAVVLAVAAAACNSSSDSLPTPTPTPTPPPNLETFNGTVAPAGSDMHTFTIATGEIDVTLTQVGDPPTTITMGLGVGQPATAGSSTCILFSNGFLSTPAGTTAQLAGSLNAGTYCVQVYDVGNLQNPVTYTVTVAHF